MELRSLEREVWTGSAVPLGDVFRLRKVKGDRELRAVCSLVTHRLGWELRLEVNGLLSRSQVCSSLQELLLVSDDWRDSMSHGGWVKEGDYYTD